MKFKQKKSNKTLSEKIADALTVKPKADIEDDQVFGTKPKTLSRADFSSSESEDDTAISDFRKRNVNFLSEISKKYEGKVVSRRELNENSAGQSEVSEEQISSDDEVDNIISNLKASINGKSSSEAETDVSGSDDEDTTKNKTQVESDSEDDSDDDGESDDYSITKFQKISKGSDESLQGEDDEEDDEGAGYDISQLEEPMQEDFEHVKKQNISEEVKKGTCVRNQMLLWEGLLEMRIHLQRCLNTANQMPLPETFEQLKTNEEFVKETNTSKANVTNVLDKLLNLQDMLLKKFPETKALSTKKKQRNELPEVKPQESDEEIPSDTEDEEIPSDTEEEDAGEKQDEKSPKKNEINIKKRKLEDYEIELATSHKAFKSFRDTTIQKWNEKTRVATATNIKNAPTNTVLQQISYILSDRNKLIRRTQLKRSEYDIIGLKKESKEEGITNETEINPVSRERKDDDEYIPEIFDDNDFYHQLLRELIECKSADISDPVQLSRQWIALQQMRSKMKRRVDTKATKGRKIKYVVHNKLLNYMAPEKCTTWTDESTNELYSSLFGKLFEHNNVGLNANLESGLKIK